MRPRSCLNTQARATTWFSASRMLVTPLKGGDCGWRARKGVRIPNQRRVVCKHEKVTVQRDQILGGEASWLPNSHLKLF